jgi:hypothetical protein
MRLVLASLLVLAPALRAQATPRAASTFSNPAAALGAPHLGVEVSWDDLRLARTFGETRALARRSDARLKIGLALDSLQAAQHPRHTVLGAVLGIALGAGAGYLVAVPRVRANERQGDGPFQQLEYLVDPLIGGLVGGVVGAVVGSHVR